MKKINISQFIFWTCLITSIGLCIAGFVIPPYGIIDPSVLTAVGELFAFAALGQLPSLLKKDKFSISHGNTHLTVGSDTAQNNDFNE